MALIIVESPTKAKTFNKILDGKDNFVYATMGHIRDLPASKMSLDFKHDFKPDYQIIKNKEKVVQELKKLAKQYKEIILATDPDREGESISYHVAEILGYIKEEWPNITLNPKKSFKRIVFHEITEHALKEALAHPEDLRIPLVKAQQARRILDRIVGYDLSPLLWKKMGKNWLSAGRVQTVALRLIVEREKEIKAFKIEDYYQIFGNFEKGEELKGKLVRHDGKPYEQKFKLNLFAGDYTYTRTTITNENLPTIKSDLESDRYIVTEVAEDVRKRVPPGPFTTSTLQQEAFQRHSFSSKMSMRLAQDLYERGFITYHRTDSLNLSEQFTSHAKSFITERYGKEYALETPRVFKTKSKMAQEAHEAVRPTKLERDISEIEADTKLTQNHKRLYKLIFERALATQMKEAEIKNMKLTIVSDKKYEFETEMQKVLFDGFLKVTNPEYAEKNQKLSPLKKGDEVKLVSLDVQDSKTKPPPRFNEASIIKTLEEKGIGRPSTYAPIISLLQDKNYIEKENKYFIPSQLGDAISDYLSVAFPDLFSLNFTAGMEESLDEIAEGEKDLIAVLSDFYKPFKKQLDEKKDDKSTIDIQQTVDEKCPTCGNPLVIRFSKFGKFLACSTFPDCKFTKPFLHVIEGKVCPLDGGRIVTRFTRTKRKFFGCENYPKCMYSTWNMSDIGKIMPPYVPKTSPTVSSAEAGTKPVESNEIKKG